MARVPLAAGWQGVGMGVGLGHGIVDTKFRGRCTNVVRSIVSMDCMFFCPVCEPAFVKCKAVLTCIVSRMRHIHVSVRHRLQGGIHRMTVEIRVRGECRPSSRSRTTWAGMLATLCGNEAAAFLQHGRWVTLGTLCGPHFGHTVWV